MNTRKTPEGWSVVKIKDIFDRVRNPVEVVLDEKYTQIGIRSHGKGIFYKEPVTGEQLGNKSVFWVEPDCFIVNIVFAWEMAVARTTIKDKGYIASHRFPMYRPKHGVLDLDFITYLFKSPRGKYLLNLASPGGAGRNKTLGQKEFEEIEILIPQSIEEQKRIAIILSTWDKVIDLKEKLIEQKKEQKKWLMHNLLTGKVRLLGFKEEWREVSLSKVVKKLKGKAVEIVSEGNFPIIDMDYLAYGTSKNYTNDGTVLAQKKDVLLLWDGSRAGMAFTGAEGSVGSTFVKLECKTVNNVFLQKNLEMNEKRIQRLREGSGIPHVPKDFLTYYKIMLPSLPEQEAIAKILALQEQELQLLEKELVNLKNQKKSIMQQLLTGKIRVKA